MLRVTYVSVARLERVTDRALQEIVSLANSRNRAANVTGGLIYTGTHFAQTIEGPNEAVIGLLSSIEKDNRHSDFRVIRREETTRRLFRSWALAYAGAASYVSQPIESAICSSNDTESSKAMVVALLVEFAKQSRRTL